MCKEIWLFMHQKNFGSDKIVHTYRTSAPSCLRMWNVLLASLKVQGIHVMINWQISKLGYPLTSVTWLERRLRFTTHWGDVIWYSTNPRLGKLYFSKTLKTSRELCFWPWLNLYIKLILWTVYVSVGEFGGTGGFVIDDETATNN